MSLLALAASLAANAQVQPQVQPQVRPQVRPQVQPKTAAPKPTSAGRGTFAHQLTASFLAEGFSLRIVALESQDQMTAVKDPRLLPTLLIAGALDDGFVHRMLSTKKFLEPAAKAGFRSVDIFSLLNHSHYVYDLSQGAIPSCDIARRVCF